MGYSKEILLDQEAAEPYICKICTNVLKDAIQVHCGADAERACRECYSQKQKYVCQLGPKSIYFQVVCFCIKLSFSRKYFGKNSERTTISGTK